MAFLPLPLQNYAIYLYGADTLIFGGKKAENNFNFHAFMKRHSEVGQRKRYCIYK